MSLIALSFWGLYTFPQDRAAASCSSSSVPIALFAPDQETIKNIQPDRLTAKVGHSTVAVKSLALDKEPRRIVLLVDNSGSMKASWGKDPEGLVNGLTSFALDTIPENASVGFATIQAKPLVIHFGSKTEVNAELTALRDQPLQPHTPLFESMISSIAAFGKPQFGDILYVVTDGQGSQSRVTLKQVRQELIAHRIRLILLLLQSPGPRNPEESPGPFFEDVVEQTGGFFFLAPLQQFDKEAERLMNSAKPVVRSQIEATYRAELDIAPLSRPESLKITLNDKHDAKIAGLRIYYPHTIAPCPSD